MANGNGVPKLSTRDVIILLAAVLSGMGGTIGYQQINPPRPDPFTGAQARAMESALRRDIERLEHIVDEHLAYSLRKTEAYDRDIASLKERCAKQRDR